MRAQRFTRASLFIGGALSSSSALAAAPNAEPSRAMAEDEVVFDNTGLGDELARQNAAERRQKYQGDSPFASSKTTYESFGGELGYHFYSGSRGANGFFAGPSFVFTRTTMSHECSSPGCSSQPDSGLITYGIAFDVGGQYLFSNGVTLGAGGGLMYLKSSETAEGGTALKFQGTLPRLLFTLGYSI